MSLTLAPRHRRLRGIPPRGCLINVKVISRREGLSQGERKVGGAGRGGGGGGGVAEAEGVTGWWGGVAGGRMSCLVPLCLPVPWWNAESHERGLLLPPTSIHHHHLAETRIWCPSQKRHCPPPDTLPVSRLNPQLAKTHTATRACENAQKQRRAGRVRARTHVADVPVCMRPTGVGFHSNSSADLKSNRTRQIPLSLDCLITVITGVKWQSRHRQS